MMESRFKRYKRYIKYLFQWLLLEKIRGLDFTMRDKSLLNVTNGAMNGYSKTDEGHSKEIFDSLRVDSHMRLLDIGCGKGAFLREASKREFSEVAGIEYVSELAEIAKRNFRILNLSDRIKVYNGDATMFKHYDKYNVIYLFNPFCDEIMDKVMRRITKQQKDDIIIILHHPTCENIIVKYGGKEINRLYDPVKSYETIIYSLEKQK